MRSSTRSLAPICFGGSRLLPAAFRFSFALRAACGIIALALCSATAAAQVTEPNGTVVPATVPNSTEKTLQSYFDSLTPKEPIDATADASPEPATFSPTCGFEATLVLSESSAAAGLAWYNVPEDPGAAPSALYQVVMETTQVGATLSSAAIRGDPNYAGGLIGFALTKFGGKPIYYSEYRRNALCTGCSMPGNWKMMLAYASKLEPDAYYLAFEDWEGANATGWPDDGDFNDKVFKLTGVRCAGGGEPCDTGLLGPCAHGLTDCANGGTPSCKAKVTPAAEICDGVDNDCDGTIDDGELCAPGAVCEHGTCLPACYGGEFGCTGGASCVDGHCIDTACMNVKCDAGMACRAGGCVAACDSIVCPLGQECSAGVCADPCAGVACASGLVCRSGVCVETCDCGGCPAALACSMQSGKCVEPGCESLSCAAGTACVAGACKDACEGAMCPKGARCIAGQCQDGSAAPAASNGAAGTGGTANAGTAAGGSGLAGTSGNTSSMGTGSRAVSKRVSSTKASRSGCNCELVGAGNRRAPSATGLVIAMLACVRLRPGARTRAGCTPQTRC